LCGKFAEIENISRCWVSAAAGYSKSKADSCSSALRCLVKSEMIFGGLNV